MNYKECFKRGLLREVEPSDEKSKESVQQAEEWLNEARINCESGAFKSAFSSAYLSVFHVSRAVLFRDGVREKSHYCIGAYLEKYVENRELEEEWVLLFDRMRSARHADHYSFYSHHTSEEIESHINTAEEFIERIKILLKKDLVHAAISDNKYLLCCICLHKNLLDQNEIVSTSHN